VFSVEERTLVVDSLLRSLNPPDPEIDRKWAIVAKRRLEELRSGRARNRQNRRLSGTPSPTDSDWSGPRAVCYPLAMSALLSRASAPPRDLHFLSKEARKRAVVYATCNASICCGMPKDL